MAKGSNAPIIIKRKKVVAGGGHHGGAWKVAYADFVTAMMAFFLMMWLLNATTEDQRKGLADYFSPEIPVARDSGGGAGMLGGISLVAEDLSGSSIPEAADGEVFDSIETKLDADSGESSVADDLLSHIDTHVSDEGLVVDIFALPGKPLFDGTRPTPLMRELVAVVDDIFRLTLNDVAVYGHVGSDAVVLKTQTVWPVSTGRAEAVRSLLASGFTGEPRIARMTGFADNDPLHPDPQDIRNNRIELVLLRESGRR